MIKSSESVDVVVRDLKLNPKCIHGPTILFSLRNGKKFFSCAGIRNRECFYLDFDKFNQENVEEFSKSSAEKATTSFTSYSEVQSMTSDQRILCRTCGVFIKSVLAHESHKILRGVSEEFMKEPSLFLPQLDNDKFNAQYFFDDTTLDFICSMFSCLNLRKVICIGAPRLHDFIRNTKPELTSILLDIDDRFEAFNPPNDFIRYNMFNNHLFNDDNEKLHKFLKDDQHNRTQHCIFSDPPFAARTELLACTFREFSSKFHKVNTHHKLLPIFLVFPYFNEAHIKKELPEMEMLDFQVSYMNHKAYHEGFKGRKAGSPVRIFTNIDHGLIKFPPCFKGYRFCSLCRRSVAMNNLHCKICNICPSKNGATYRHCPSCILCVKPNLIHCSSCNRCVSKINHDCAIYQKHQECWLCSHRGHVEKNCKFMRNIKRSKVGTCAICKGKEKHNLKNCPRKKNF